MGAADSPSTSEAPPLNAAPLTEEYEQPNSLKTVSAITVANPSTTATRSSVASSNNDLGSIITQDSAIAARVIELSETKGSNSSQSTDVEEAKRMLERVERTVIIDGDSDLEVDTEVPSLESLVSWEVLKHLKPKEKKRQEVINGIFNKIILN